MLNAIATASSPSTPPHEPWYVLLNYGKLAVLCVLAFHCVFEFGSKFPTKSTFLLRLWCAENIYVWYYQDWFCRGRCFWHFLLRSWLVSFFGAGIAGQFEKKLKEAELNFRNITFVTSDLELSRYDMTDMSALVWAPSSAPAYFVCWCVMQKS